MVSSRAYGMDNLPTGELISSTTSPEKTYTVNAYCCSGNATTDFSVRCEVVNNTTKEKRNFYWMYHQSTVTPKWLNDKTIDINGIELNVKTDSYDWRD